MPPKRPAKQPKQPRLPEHATAPDAIRVRGARVHNLRDLSVDIPRDRLVVITGVSGSGKSSLAFDTIFAEGQRRYVESLSAYARQFLGQMEKPDVESIEGLSPAISIDQKGTSKNPRSTVGTVTEIYDYLRLLYARVGIPHCPACGVAIAAASATRIADEIEQLPDGSKLLLLAPLIADRKTEGLGEYEKLKAQGWTRVRVDGTLRELETAPKLDKKFKHTIEVVVDRIAISRAESAEMRSRLVEAVEQGLKLGDGKLLVAPHDGKAFAEIAFSERFACPTHGAVLPEIEPRTFSFNSPHGACPACNGLGVTLVADEGAIVDPDKSIRDGALLRPWGKMVMERGWWRKRMLEHAAEKKVPTGRLWSELTRAQQHWMLKGRSDDFPGLFRLIEERGTESDSEFVRTELGRFLAERPCGDCAGARLRPEALAVTVAGRNLGEITALPIDEAKAWADSLAGTLSARDREIAKLVLREIAERLRFLVDVGLTYLTLGRAANSLSGGEAQRIRLASQVGSGLTGVLYVLDEPSIGLHQRDNDRLLGTLLRLRDLGNTVLVVEHDEDTIRAADHVIDIGPGAGEHGGLLVAAGSVTDIENSAASVTGAYLRGERGLGTPPARRAGDGRLLELRGARENNLHGVDVAIPLGTLTLVTGVSGSGKSSLVSDVLLRALRRELGIGSQSSREAPGAHDAIIVPDGLERVIEIDQSPIGRTPRSNPATYIGAFDPIRNLFAATPDARARGWKAGRFSFNVPRAGRCETCTGDGELKIEMQFLPDVYVVCEACGGARYNRETLDVHYKGKSIADVLRMTVEEAVPFFAAVQPIARPLQTLLDVGLGYMRLGQPATTLSGGEAQRVKLAAELSRRGGKASLYVLDEPTTGLHFADVERLIGVLERLVEGGASVLVIEHNLDVIRRADQIIDLGPEGGTGGGRLVVAGTPEQVAATKESHTGRYLAPLLRKRRP
jgi:excinuclease ABC subunit A